MTPSIPRSRLALAVDLVAVSMPLPALPERYEPLP